MHRLLVLYNKPTDPEHLKKHYAEVHLPLCAKMHGVKASSHSYEVKTLDPGQPPFFCVFEADFESEQAMSASLSSEEGQAVAADVAKYASGGVTILHFPITA